MSAVPAFSIRYWGTTGTFPAPLKPREVAEKLRHALLHLAKENRLNELAKASEDPAQFEQLLQKYLPFHLRSTYGGNTTCVEVQTSDALWIIDCGTGFRELGMDLDRRWNAPDFNGKREAHVIVSHAHMDHTFATPYFDPYVDTRNHFTLYAMPVVMKSIDVVLNPASPLSSIYVPTTFDLLKAIRQRIVLKGGMTIAVGGTTLSTLELRHPGGCLGFRFDCQGRSFVFCTDHEQTEAPDPTIVDFARGADVLYLDAQYLAAEYEGRLGIMGEPPLSRRGWGHTTVEGCALTAAAAGVRQLHAGHREPKRDDMDLARVEKYVQQCLADALRQHGLDVASCTACVPYEGMIVELAAG